MRREGKLEQEEEVDLQVRSREKRGEERSKKRRKESEQWKKRRVWIAEDAE